MNHINQTGIHTTIKSFVLILVLFLLTGKPALLNDTPGQLKGEPAAITNQFQKVQWLIARAESETNAMQAVEYGEQAVFLADSLNLPEQMARARHKCGVAWRNFGDHLMADQRLNQALALFSELKQTKKKYIVRRELGDLYRASQNHDMAMDMLRETLSYFDTTSDTVEMAATLDRLAATGFEQFFMLADRFLLEEYLNKEPGVFLRGMRQHPELVAMYQLVTQYLDRALLLARQTDRTDLVISNNIIRAAVLNRAHDYEQALVLIDETLDMMRQSGITRDMPLVLVNKARIVGEPPISNPRLAMEIAEEAVMLATEANIRIYIFMAGEVLYLNAHRLKDFELAFKYFRENVHLLNQFQNDRLRLLAQSRQFELQIMEREYEIGKGSYRLQVLAVSIVLLTVGFALFMVILMRKNRQTRHLFDQLSHMNLVISKQNKDLLAANADKDRLFSIIAHDLKNPFNSILGFSGLLMRKVDNPVAADVQKYATHINTSASQTMLLLDNLLDWARLQRGKLLCAPRDLSMKDTVHGVAEQAEEMAAIKDVRIIQQVPDALMVRADEDMLKTILRNLLGNAIKFSNPGGQVTISGEEKGGEIHISVADKGIGISKEDLPRLFDENTKRSKEGTQNEKGTGLGLVLCREFVEKHGGKIWVESEPGKGSVFTFSLPVNPEGKQAEDH